MQFCKYFSIHFLNVLQYSPSGNMNYGMSPVKRGVLLFLR